MSGRALGPVIGAVIGGIVGFYAAPVGAALGASIGAADDTGAAALPKFACPRGMSALLSPLVDLPFRLGSHDPDSGAIDCLGVVTYV